MTFKARVFDEPLLEFGDGGQHFDPRQGLREFGPLQPRSGDVVRVGVIGTEDTVAGFSEFLAETARGIESESKQLINLNPDSRLPGLGNQNPFRCKFEVPEAATATLSRRQVNDIRTIGRHDEAVQYAVTLMVAQADDDEKRGERHPRERQQGTDGGAGDRRGKFGQRLDQSVAAEGGEARDAGGKPRGAGENDGAPVASRLPENLTANHVPAP